MKTHVDIEAYLPAAARLLKERGEPGFRLKQVYDALAFRHVGSWEEVTNLPTGLRAALAQEVPAWALELRRVSQATDTR